MYEHAQSVFRHGATREANNAVEIVVIDDHRLFREGIRGLLSAEDGLQVLAEGEVRDAVELAGLHRPGIMLLGMQKSDPSPVMTIREIAKVSPDTQVVGLSTHTDNDLIPSLVSAGAAAYLSKNIGARELCTELRLVAGNSRMFAILVPRRPGAIDQDVIRSTAALTDREIEILGLVSLAMTNSQIATKLFVSEATVKRHLTNVFAKVKARSRLDAVNRAIALGLLDGPQGRSRLV
nr:response regulator transcription factor [Streptomyces sp. NBC_00886]